MDGFKFSYLPKRQSKSNKDKGNAFELNKDTAGNIHRGDGGTT